MTNGEYKRLTTGGYTNPKLLREYRDRLYDLENAIDDGKLVFLPYKVGDTFWCLADYGTEYVVTRHIVQEVSILNNVTYLYDENGGEYDMSDLILFATKEAAEKALEELKKC